MNDLSLQAKKAYYAKVRQSNYAASLRLEGFDITQESTQRPVPPLQSVLETYRKKSS
jgi:hypothetical protein